MDDLIKYWFLQAVLILVWCVEAMLEPAIGFTVTRGKSEERLLALLDYSRSAHVVKVLWRANESMIKRPRIENFLFKHGEYVHPDYVVRNKARLAAGGGEAMCPLC